MNIKGFFTRKKIIWGVVILLLAGGVAWRVKGSKSDIKSIVVETVKKQQLKRTILATGQVISGTDLSLSFKGSGVVQNVNVREGGKVKSGAVLAQLSQRDQLATLTQARGALAQAQASYQKILAGATDQEVAVAMRAVDAAQITLENAKKSREDSGKQQEVLVKNAYLALLNSGLAATPAISNSSTAAPAVSGTYTGTEQGEYKVALYSSGSGMRFQASGLESGEGMVNSTGPVALGNKGLYLQFSSGALNSNDTWTIAIPNTKASTYVSNYNSYQSALETQKVAETAAANAVAAAQVALDQAKASLDLKMAKARPVELDVARAQILSAEGQVQAAEAALENTVIRAPADGTITQVDVKAGEQAVASREAIMLQDVGNLHIEANISEANIASINTGQSVDVTFDALGADRHFKASVQTVNPASTVVSGVVNYKVTAALGNLEEIKPGMTANMTVLVAEKDGVLSIPLRAVISNGEKKVRVITDSRKKTYKEVPVQTGLEADGGLVEITSGLSEGQEVVTLIKK